MTEELQSECNRFMAFVAVGSGCWTWQGSQRGSGYGSFRMHGKTVTAHRAAWQLFRGPIPSGMGFHGTCVLHACDNRLCVNPDHLFLGTNRDNAVDCARKGRKRMPHAERASAQKSKTHCRLGHPYLGDNLYTHPDGRRGCRLCRQSAGQRHKEKKRVP